MSYKLNAIFPMPLVECLKLYFKRVNQINDQIDNMLNLEHLPSTPAHPEVTQEQLIAGYKERIMTLEAANIQHLDQIYALTSKKLLFLPLNVELYQHQINQLCQALTKMSWEKDDSFYKWKNRVNISAKLCSLVTSLAIVQLEKPKRKKRQFTP
jgi:hypothetical protein